MVGSHAPLSGLRENMAKLGNCYLCDTYCELQNSHVLPAFIFRWVRETSATGYIRFGEKMNQRAQDGVKKPWLCSSCEGILGESERQFASLLFHPYAEGCLTQRGYGPWLLKFCVSLSWRVLHWFLEENVLDDYSDTEHEVLIKAEKVWKEYLLGLRPHPASFRQHLFLASSVEATGGDVASNINRHLMRSSTIDLIKNKSKHLVYTKLPRFFIFGVLRDERPSDWQGTKVNANHGVIPYEQKVPDVFFGYMNGRAHDESKLHASMSDRQKKKITDAFLGDLDRVKASDSLQAMRRDMGY